MKPKKNLKKEFQEKVLENIPANIPHKDLEFWFQDESRIGQKGTISRHWVPKGTRPRAIRQQQHLSAYIFGAVCPEKEKSAALILPECNMAMMKLHLEEIEKLLEPGKHIVLLLDQASWHTSHNLQSSPRITLLPIPPYSPELNPMEQVWQWLKHVCLSNRVFKDFDEIVDATADAWNRFLKECSVKTMCYRSWANMVG